MDNENIASILKDAINASTAKIQSESKRTKVFVLPPELLKGLLGKNETPNSNNTSKDETSTSTNNKKTTTDRRQSSKNSKSTASPVDRPKRANNRQSASAKIKNSRSQKASKNNAKGLKDIEENHEQNIVSENNETSDTTTPVEKVTIQKKLNRGRKAKTKKENERSDSCNLEKSPDTILDKNQEKFTENNDDIDDCCINELSDKPSDSSTGEKCTTRISDKSEENCAKNNHKLEDYSIDEVSSNVIQENDVTITETIPSNCEKKLFDETIKVPDIQTEVIDQILQDPQIEISQSYASQKILNGEISSGIELNDDKGANVLSPESNQLSNGENITIIEEETYIVEEIIEIIESDEENVLEENDEKDTLYKNNIQTDKVLPIDNTDFSSPISVPTIIKSEPVSESVSVDFQPIDEQKKLSGMRVYVNKKKSRKQISDIQIQKESVPLINSECNTDSVIENSCEVLQNLHKVQRKTDENNLTIIPRTEIDYDYDVTCLPNISPIKLPITDKFEKLDYLQEDQESSDLESNCDFGQDSFMNTSPIESDEDLCEKLEYSQKTQEKSNSDKECTSDERSLTNIAGTETSTENQCQQIKYSKVQEQQQPSNFDKLRHSLTERDNSAPIEKPTENLREELKSPQHIKEKTDLNNFTDLASTDLEHDKVVSLSENSVQKSNTDSKILAPVEELVESLHNHKENTEEIQSIENTKKTKDANKKLKNQTEHVAIKVNNTRSRRKSSSAKNDVESVSGTADSTKEQTENDVESVKNYVSDGLVNNNVDQTTAASETLNSCNNTELGKGKDYWENEKNCSIKSLRQLRNRTKVIPQDPENFNKLKNNIEKESLHLRNRDKSDIIVRIDYGVINRTRSVSLNLEPNSSDKLPGSAKKISRKPQSTDNHLENADRISTLRRRSAILENEAKLPAVLEESNKVQSQNGEIDKKNVNESTALNTNQKVEGIIAPDSHLNENNSDEKLSCNTDDLQKQNVSTETAVGKSSSSLKSEKIIVVRKIKKGRRSKSSQQKDELAVTADLERSDNESNETDNDSKVTGNNIVTCDNVIENNHAQIETSKTAENTILSKSSVEDNLNKSFIDSPKHPEHISVKEQSLKIKKEKVTPPKKRGRGKLASSTRSKEVAVENPKNADESMSLSEDNLDKVPEIKSTDASNKDNEVENALNKNRVKIKIEKASPVRRGRRGRFSKSVGSNEIPSENAKDAHEKDDINNSTTSSTQKADGNMILPEDNVNKILESNYTDPPATESQEENASEESRVKIKIEKVSPVKKGRRGRRSKSFPSVEFAAENTKDNFDVIKNSHELESVNGINDKEDSNLDNALECSPVDTSTASGPVESALDIKTEKVPSVKRGRRGRRSKSTGSKDNSTKEAHKEDDKVDTGLEVLKDNSPDDNIPTNHSAASITITENEENATISFDLECNSTESTKADDQIENSRAQTRSKVKSQTLSATKKGRRGRRSKSSQLDVSTKANEDIDNDCTTSFVENNADSQDENSTQLEEPHAEIPGNKEMEIDSDIGENNDSYENNLDTTCNDEMTPVDDETKEKPEKRASRFPRRSSRHDNKQEPMASNKDNVDNTKRRGRRSSKINAKSDIVDSDDETKEKESRNMRVRKSGRVKKSTVNYRIPDEDVDVIDSERRIENAPKKRRGRPSRKDILELNASTEENPKHSLQDSTQRDTDLDATANDFDSPSADVSISSTRKRRATKRSTIDEDIFEVESKPIAQEKSLDISDEPQAEALSDAANVTNDFEDSHFSDKHDEEEDEDFVEKPKIRRGRKRKYSYIAIVPRGRGRPPAKRKVEHNDEDYAPHHSYVPRASKAAKEKAKEAADKKIVKCGKCGKEVAKHQWYSHNLYSHNDMGWLDGTEKPDFENDQKLLTRVLTCAHKKRHKKGLICETCREVKKSVMGFISHMTFCGKTEEEITSLLVTCDQCGGKFKPASMEYHERQHRLEGDVKKKKEKEMAEKLIDLLEPRSKRKAAEKAVARISEFTALVKDEDGFSAAKKLKLSSPHINKFIQKPLAKKKIPSLSIAKWKRDLENNRDAACSQLGCQFTCKSLDEMREHYSSCNFTVTENYVCKICRFQTLFEDEIIKHAEEKHASDDFDGNAAISDSEASDSEDYSEFDEDSGSNEEQSKKGLIKKFFYKETSDVENKMFKFIFNNGACHTILNKSFLSGYQWTLEYERKHFKFRLFNDLTPNDFTLLKGKDAESYLPELDQSMPVRFVKKDSPSSEPEWQNWARFEASCVDDSPTFFVGGPVWAMAWAPTPSFLAISDDLPQFLAVSTHPAMDVEYSVGQSYSGKNIIQIWSVGKLNNRNGSDGDPELSYAIAHNGGTVWSMEWCPSGCYQHEDFPNLKDENDSNRLGLLAAGCSDGCVYIYSLTFPQDLLHSPNENQYPIYTTEPVVKLIVDSGIHDSYSESWQVMKICWSRESNHNVIVAGFSNGYVAFWDLSTKSPLLRYSADGTTFFRPHKLFFAHHHAVTMVALVNQDNKRYLATAGLDKQYKFWDLEDISKPKNTYKKSYVTDGAWMNNWCCAVLAHDDALCMGNNPIVCLPLRNYTYKYYNLLPSNSTVYGISTSDFGNSLATGNVAGELLTLFPHQLMYIRDMEKTIPPKRNYSLVSTTELVDFKAEPATESSAKKDKKVKKEPYADPTNFKPSTYKESKDRFGIQFSTDTNLYPSKLKKPKNASRKLTLTCEKLSQIAIEQYPLKSINKVAWNPNASSFLWLAAGYQNGFVRLISVRSAGSAAELDKLLQSHTNALKAQLAKAAAEDEC